MEKKWSKFARFIKKKVSISPDFYDKFQYVAKNIEGSCLFFSNFISSCSQIWPNHIIDDRHLSYIKNWRQKKKKNPDSTMSQNLKQLGITHLWGGRSFTGLQALYSLDSW
jgi:hypothetical protein